MWKSKSLRLQDFGNTGHLNVWCKDLSTAVLVYRLSIVSYCFIISYHKTSWNYDHTCLVHVKILAESHWSRMDWFRQCTTCSQPHWQPAIAAMLCTLLVHWSGIGVGPINGWKTEELLEWLVLVPQLDCRWCWHKIIQTYTNSRSLTEGCNHKDNYQRFLRLCWMVFVLGYCYNMVEVIIEHPDSWAINWNFKNLQ